MKRPDFTLRPMRKLVSSGPVLIFATACIAHPPSVASHAADIRHDPHRFIPAATQQLLDALPGDSTVWQRYLSERAVYVSEAGVLASKRDLLESFRPFPEGLTGSIQVRTVQLTNFGDVAVHVFDAHERQTVYDQQIEVNYRSTHTWRLESGEWRLIAAQNVVLARDPAALPVTSRLADYAGMYELSGRRRYRVETRGDSLVGGPEGSELRPLIPIGENVFADAGSNPGIIRVFVRDPDGTVQRMVQRRKFADLTWVKVAEIGTDPARLR
jgi:hypothetical protein